MSHTDMSRRGLLKTSFLGAAAAGATSFGLSSQAQAKQAANAQTYDAVVLGAGPAGLIAAITAHDAGAKVVVLEKRDRPDGNAIFALGSICGWGTRHQAEQGIKDTAEDFYAMMMDVSKQMGDKALNRCYTDNISAGIDWLEKDIGVKFGKIRPMPYPRLGRTCRVMGEGLTGGAQLVQKLLAACAKRGIEVKYQHKAVELIHDDLYAVKGVKAATPEGFKTFMARGGVCIATGGFSANPEMVDRYIGGWATRMVLRGSKSTTGENISLCMPLYTKFVNMDQFHSGPILGKTHVNPADVLNSGYGVQVNTTTTPLPRNRVRVTMNVDEGSASSIKQIRFVGNNLFDADELMDLMQLSEHKWSSWYTRRDLYSREKLAADLETLRSFYLNQGYLDFKIDSVQVSVAPNKADVFITINMTEGEKYTVSGVKVRSAVMPHEAVNGLPRGIYIVGTRKFAIK